MISESSFAAWGVDYLKLDSCNSDDTPAKVEIAIMRDALNATGRPIFFSLCGMDENDQLLSTHFFLFFFQVVSVVVIH